MRHETRKTKRWAFTIVELLTVMGVIALLIGLLAPALNAVRRVARDTKQKAQFNSIKAGLEMFRADMGDYPESGNKPLYNSASAVTTGAQHLAEALLGRDLRGFDPQSTWDADVDNGANKAIIYANNSKSSPQQVTDCDNRRKGPYLDVENVGVFNVDQLYQVGNALTPNIYIYGATDMINPGSNLPSPFITDVYTDKTVTLNYRVGGVDSSKNVRAGSPVLYFKANTTAKDLRRTTAPLNADWSDRTYNFYDNAQVLELGKMSAWNGSKPALGEARFHPMANPAGTNGYVNFYSAITNYQIPNDEGVAYRSDTYILMSAGRDGLFGTTDDIYNFGD